MFDDFESKGSVNLSHQSSIGSGWDNLPGNPVPISNYDDLDGIGGGGGGGFPQAAAPGYGGMEGGGGGGAVPMGYGGLPAGNYAAPVYSEPDSPLWVVTWICLWLITGILSAVVLGLVIAIIVIVYDNSYFIRHMHIKVPVGG